MNYPQFAGWPLYFPTFDVNADQDLFVRSLLVIRKGISYFNDTNSDFEMPSDFSVLVDYESLKEVFSRGNDLNFENLLSESPDFVLSCLGVAFYEVMFGNEDPRDQGRWPKVNVRVKNFSPSLNLKDLKSFFIGKFVRVTGTVIRMGSVKPIVLDLDFECMRCNGRQTLHLVDGKYNPPTKCPTPSCRSKLFEPLRNTANTEDFQTLRIQEILSPEVNNAESGRVPRSVQVHLHGDLVDSCVPGDNIQVCGVVRAMNTDVPIRGKKPDKGMFLIYVDAVSVVNERKHSGLTGELTDEFSEQDLFAIQAIASEPNVFGTIVNSLCPTIFGHELVKAGLTLALFGGCQKFESDRNKVSIRGDPHVLICGDPGLGKSQLLQSVHQLTSRGVYVCGSYSSTTGLTVTLLREKGTGDFTLEAGALVLADKGVCCIDEFDKMSKEHSALLEAMEQQTVSIAKAGIVCTLPARASVVAAANPISGHYDRKKTVSENLKMGAPLLSRFDLVFIILDRPDEIMDKVLSEHVMSLHSGAKSGRRISAGRRAQKRDQNEQRSIYDIIEMDPNSFDPIPHQLLRKYISYARKHVKPTLSIEAGEVLQEFYLSLRKNYKSSDHTPVTTRQLESLIRLSEARAKVELREIVSEQDARDVIEIMRESLMSVMEDDLGLGFVDFRKVTGMSKSKQAVGFVEALKKHSNVVGKKTFAFNELRDFAVEIGMKVDKFDDFLDQLNFQGYLLSKGNRKYEVS